MHIYKLLVNVFLNILEKSSINSRSLLMKLYLVFLNTAFSYFIVTLDFKIKMI